MLANKKNGRPTVRWLSSEGLTSVRVVNLAQLCFRRHTQNRILASSPESLAEDVLASRTEKITAVPLVLGAEIRPLVIWIGLPLQTGSGDSESCIIECKQCAEADRPNKHLIAREVNTASLQVITNSCRTPDAGDDFAEPPPPPPPPLNRSSGAQRAHFFWVFKASESTLVARVVVFFLGYCRLSRHTPACGSCPWDERRLEFD